MLFERPVDEGAELAIPHVPLNLLDPLPLGILFKPSLEAARLVAREASYGGGDLFDCAHKCLASVGRPIPINQPTTHISTQQAKTRTCPQLPLIKPETSISDATSDTLLTTLEPTPKSTGRARQIDAKKRRAGEPSARVGVVIVRDEEASEGQENKITQSGLMSAAS